MPPPVVPLLKLTGLRSVPVAISRCSGIVVDLPGDHLIDIANDQHLAPLRGEVPKLHGRLGVGRFCLGRTRGRFRRLIKPGDDMLAIHFDRQRVCFVVLMNDHHVTDHVLAMGRLNIDQLITPLESGGASCPGRITVTLGRLRLLRRTVIGESIRPADGTVTLREGDPSGANSLTMIVGPANSNC